MAWTHLIPCWSKWRHSSYPSRCWHPPRVQGCTLALQCLYFAVFARPCSSHPMGMDMQPHEHLRGRHPCMWLVSFSCRTFSTSLLFRFDHGSTSKQGIAHQHYQISLFAHHGRDQFPCCALWLDSPHKCRRENKNQGQSPDLWSPSVASNEIPWHPDQLWVLWRCHNQASCQSCQTCLHTIEEMAHRKTGLSCQRAHAIVVHMCFSSFDVWHFHCWPDQKRSSDAAANHDNYDPTDPSWPCIPNWTITWACPSFSRRDTSIALAMDDCWFLVPVCHQVASAFDGFWSVPDVWLDCFATDYWFYPTSTCHRPDRALWTACHGGGHSFPMLDLPAVWICHISFAGAA